MTTRKKVILAVVLLAICAAVVSAAWPERHSFRVVDCDPPACTHLQGD
ncbi:hypothetical protein ABN028_19335 [Actinopolymorpha sp. B17G11]